MAFPIHRPRRLRASSGLRAMLRETELSPNDFVMPVFVRPGKNERRPIVSMPGQFQFSPDTAASAVKEAAGASIPAAIVFGIPEKKDENASGAFAAKGIVQESIRAIKDVSPDTVVIADLCFCEYTDHGHCGIVRRQGKGAKESFVLDNDETLDLIAKTAVSQAKAGADVIAPSGMTDGMVKTIREALDGAGFKTTVILSYAVKYASAYYGPFRDAAESPPQFGDRASYQMDPGNFREALREAALDVEEGADMLMVKPGLPCLDVLKAVRERFGLPTAAYSVSGEYSMIKAAAERGWVDEKKVALESLTALKRAGADFVITYHALDAARWLGA